MLAAKSNDGSNHTDSWKEGHAGKGNVKPGRPWVDARLHDGRMVGQVEFQDQRR